MKPNRILSLAIALAVLAGAWLTAVIAQAAPVEATTANRGIAREVDGMATMASALPALDQVPTMTLPAGPTPMPTRLPTPTSMPTSLPAAPTMSATATATSIPTTVPPALTVGAVIPGTVINGVDNTLLIEGSGYVNPVLVEIAGSGYGLLDATINGRGISLVLPAHFPPGSYNVVVHNGDGTAGAATNTLTVLSPTPTLPIPPTAANTPTSTPAPSGTPAPTQYVRPLLSVRSYGASSTVLTPGEDVDFEMTLENTGVTAAQNIVVTFVRGDLIPRVTGGVITIVNLAPGETARFWQPLTVKSSLSNDEAILNVQVEYTDWQGTKYTASFDLAFPVKVPVWSSTATPTPTPTPTPTLSVRPQIIIESYRMDPNPLYPGAEGQLQLELINASGETARQVVTSLEFSADNLQVLVPLSSNRRFVAQIDPGERVTLPYDLAVAGDASAGLVPIDVSVSYLDDQNSAYQDTNTIGLQVETRPAFLVTLYQEVPTTIQVGATFELPVRVTNIGLDDVNVSTIEVTSDHFTVTNGVLYVGPIYASASGSLLAQVGATQPGTATVTVAINYLDEFQQPQKYTHVFTFQVQENRRAPDTSGSTTSPGTQGPRGNRTQASITVGQRILQAILGFLGLATRTTLGTGATFP
jgi:uncharacterized repeat protein (TIGR01451 family)